MQVLWLLIRVIGPILHHEYRKLTKELNWRNSRKCHTAWFSSAGLSCAYSSDSLLWLCNIVAVEPDISLVLLSLFLKLSFLPSRLKDLRFFCSNVSSSSAISILVIAVVFEVDILEITVMLDKDESLPVRPGFRLSESLLLLRLGDSDPEAEVNLGDCLPLFRSKGSIEWQHCLHRITCRNRFFT